MSDIPLHTLRPGRKTYRTRFEEPLATRPASSASMSKTVAVVARQKKRHHERYVDEVEQEEGQSLLDHGEYEDPITVLFNSLPLAFIANYICSLRLLLYPKHLHSITRISQERYLLIRQVGTLNFTVELESH